MSAVPPFYALNPQLRAAKGANQTRTRGPAGLAPAPSVYSVRSPHLVIDQTPLFQERMNPHDGTNISTQVPPTSGNGKILLRLKSISMDHKIAIILVNCGYFGSILAIEEFRQGASFDGMDRG